MNVKNLNLSGDVFWSSCSRRSSNKYTRFPSCYCILSHFSYSFWWDTKKRAAEQLNSCTFDIFHWLKTAISCIEFIQNTGVCLQTSCINYGTVTPLKRNKQKCNDLAIVHFSLLFVLLSKVTGPNTFHLANNLWNDNFLYFLFMLNHDFTIIFVLFVTTQYKVLFRLCCVCVVLPFLSLTSTKHHEWSKGNIPHPLFSYLRKAIKQCAVSVLFCQVRFSFYPFTKKAIYSAGCNLIQKRTPTLIQTNVLWFANDICFHTNRRNKSAKHISFIDILIQVLDTI